VTGVDRKTIRRYEREANSPGVATGSEAKKAADEPVQNPPLRPPARPPNQARSACEEHRAWIEAQVELGRNAQSIYQDLVEGGGFTHQYNSVKRFVRGLKDREPERFDVLESQPAEECQVDFGLGALTLYAVAILGAQDVISRYAREGSSSSSSSERYLPNAISKITCCRPRRISPISAAWGATAVVPTHQLLEFHRRFPVRAPADNPHRVGVRNLHCLHTRTCP
jgi:hypothetical protein